MRLDPPPRIDRRSAGSTGPRRARVVHPLIGIVAIASRAPIAGADDLVATAGRAGRHEGGLGRPVDLGDGIPPHDRLDMVSRRLNPAEFGRRSPARPAALHDTGGGRLPAVDGKATRRFDSASARSALHMVGAWAVSRKQSIAQVAVTSKSDEITAIPEALELVELVGAAVTIDAMGRQADVAEAIVAGVDHVPAVKGDQPTLRDGIVDHFPERMGNDFARAGVSRHETRESGHGRVENRTCLVLDIPADQPDAGRWKGLKRIGVAISGTTSRATTCATASRAGDSRTGNSGRRCGAAGGSRAR